MSYNLGEATGKITLETDFTSLSEAEAALARFRKAGDATGSAASKQGDAIKGSLNKTANAAGVAGGTIAAGFAYAVKSASDFQFTMSAVQSVSGATASQMDQISKASLRIGADTTFSAAQAGQAFEELVKAGISVEDAIGGAADATVALAAAGQIALPEAASIASNAMNQFNLSAAELPNVADKIAGAANASAIDVGDFAQSLSQVGAVANLAGANFDDTAAAIALMGNAGIKGSDAGTSLKTMLMNLSPQTKKAREEMMELGIITEDGANKFYDAQGNLKDLGSVAQTLQDSLKGLTNEQKQNALATLFGSDAIRGAAIVSGAGAKGFTEMADAMGKVSAADVAATRMDNLQGAVEALSGSVETAAILIGTPLLNALTNVVDGIVAAVNGFAQLSSGAQQTITIVAGVAGSLLLLVSAGIKIGLAMQEARNMLILATGATTLFGNAGVIAAAKTKILAAANVLLTKSLLRNPFVAILAAIVALVGGFIAMNGGVDGAMAALQPFFAFLGGLAKTILPQLQGALGEAASILGEIFAPVLSALQSAFATLLPVLTSAGAQISGSFGAAVATVSPLLKTLGILLVGNILPAILQVAQSALPPLLAAFAQLAPVLVQLVGSVLMTVATLAGALIPVLVQVVSAVVPVVAQLVSSLLPVFAQIVAAVIPMIAVLAAQLVPVFAQIVSAIVPVISMIVGQLVPVIGDLISIIGPVVAALVGALLPVFSALVSAIMPLVSTLISVLVPVISQVISAVMPLVTTLIGLLVPAFKIVANIVTAVMAAIVPIIQSAMQVITGVINVVLGLLTGNWEQVWSGLGGIVQGAFGIVKGVLTGAMNIIKTVIGGALDFVGNIFSTVFGGLGGKVSAAGGGVMNAIKAIGSGIVTGFNAVINWFAQLPAKIGSFLMALPGILLNAAITALKAFFYGLVFSIAVVVLFFTTTLPNAIATALANIGNWLMTTGVSLLMGLLNGIVAAFVFISDFFAALPGRIIAFLAAAGSWLVSAGTAALVGMYNGVVAGFTAVNDFFAALPGRVIAFLAAAGAWLVGAGVALLNGLRNGIVNGYTAVVAFFTSLPGRVKAFLAAAGSWLVSAGLAALRGMATGLSNGYSAVSSFLTGLPGKIKAGLSGAASWLVSAGKDIVNGLVNGIKSMVGSAASAAANLAKSAVDSAKKFLHIKSPSRVFYDIGVFVGKGLENGIKSTVAQIRSASEGIAKVIGKAFGSKQISRSVAEALYAANASAQKYMIQMANSADRLVDRVKSAQKKLADLSKAKADYAKAVKSGIVGAVDAADQASSAGYIMNLKDQIARTKEFAATLAKLKKNGLDKGTYDQLVQGGLDAAPMAESIAAGGKTAIKQIAKLKGQLNSAAGSLASATSNTMYGAGVRAAQGIVNGLKSQQRELDRAMDRVANRLVQRVKSALKIHSPSRLMADEVGAMIPAGVANGVENNLRALNANGASLVQSLMHGISSQYPDLREQLGGLSTIIPSDVQSMVAANVTTNTPPTTGETTNNNTWNITTSDDPVLWARAMGREYENLKVGS